MSSSGEFDDDAGTATVGLNMKVGEKLFLTEDEGVEKELLVEGEGTETPQIGDEVFVHYTGTLLDGTKFDSSRDRDQQFSFKLGEGMVIKGWDTGVATMKKNEKVNLTIKPDYGYGAAGSPPTIPANATLKFEVELFSWKSQKDILNNGGIMKTIVKKGTGYKKPKNLDEVVVRYVAKLPDGTVLKETGEEGVAFTIDEGHLCEGLKKTVETMLVGEAVTCEFFQDYGKGVEGLPEGSPLLFSMTLLAIRSVENIQADGSVLKKTLTEGSGYDHPQDDASVEATWKAYLEDGTMFESRQEENSMKWVVGAEEVIPGLDSAVQQMKLGEKALVTIASQWAFGSEAVEKELATIPAHSTVKYEIVLVSFENEKAAYLLSTAEKFESAEAKKTEGNELFKAGKYERALKKYSKALSTVESDHSFNDEEKTKAKALKIPLHLNKAAVLLKTKQYAEVKTVCNKALELDSSNVKALFRRSQAFTGSKDFQEAAQDLKRIVELDPKNREARLEYKRVKEQQKEEDKKQSKMYGNMFSRLAEKDLYSEQIPVPTGADDPVEAMEEPTEDKAPVEAMEED